MTRPPDRERLETLLRQLVDCVTGLRALDISRPMALQQDRALRWAAERGLQIALQIVLDVGAHLLAARGFTAFDSYRDVIEGLGGTGILPVDFAQSIAGMAGVRNALVHGYASLDPERVGDCVTNRLPDFERFVACVLAYLDGLQAE